MPADVAQGQTAKKLKASKCLPGFVHEQTLAGAVGTAEKCHEATTPRSKSQ
jgi:hypothetical protein